MEAALRKLIFLASLGLSAIFWFACYFFYFKWLDCFNEMGRCFDSDTGVVYLEQSKLFWVPLAVLASCFSFYQLWRLTR
jgi:hypothetical protein